MPFHLRVEGPFMNPSPDGHVSALANAHCWHVVNPLYEQDADEGNILYTVIIWFYVGFVYNLTTRVTLGEALNFAT